MAILRLASLLKICILFNVAVFVRGDFKHGSPPLATSIQVEMYRSASRPLSMEISHLNVGNRRLITSLPAGDREDMYTGLTLRVNQEIRTLSRPSFCYNWSRTTNPPLTNPLQTTL